MNGLLRLLPALFLAIRVWKVRRIFVRFRAAGATSPESARSLAELGIEPSRTLARLERRNLLRELPEGRYYLDEIAYEKWTRRRLVLAAVLLVVLVVVVSLFLSCAEP